MGRKKSFLINHTSRIKVKRKDAGIREPLLHPAELHARLVDTRLDALPIAVGNYLDKERMIISVSQKTSDTGQKKRPVQPLPLREVHRCQTPLNINTINIRNDYGCHNNH